MSSTKKASRVQKTPKKETYHHGDLPRALVAAAVELIREKGVEGLSLRETARRAGVSVAAPYRHFASKQDLLAAVAAEGFREFGAALCDAVTSTEGDAFDRLTAIGQRYVRFAVANPSFIKVMFGSEFRSHDEYPEVAAAGEQAYGHLQRTVRACHEQVGSDADVDVTAIMAWSLVHGLSSLLMSNKMRSRTPEEVERLIAAVLLNFERGLRSSGTG